MRLLVVGHGRMGQLVEKLAPEHGFEVAAIAEVHTPVAVALEAPPSRGVATAITTYRDGFERAKGAGALLWSAH